jgi:hypothetical protein
LGRYRGILFKDTEGNYYTTDKGELLKMLDLSTITAGQTTAPIKITLLNSTGYAIEDILIYPLNTNMPTNAQVRFSFNDAPFIPLDELYIAQSLNDGESKDFYVSIYTQPGRGKLNSEFQILTSATAS